METKAVTPILFPYDPAQFWELMRAVIREEVSKIEKEKAKAVSYETAGLTYKPLFKMEEICKIFQVSKPTIYEWVKDGRLKPYKIRARVYFLWNDIQQLLNPSTKSP